MKEFIFLGALLICPPLVSAQEAPAPAFTPQKPTYTMNEHVNEQVSTGQIAATMVPPNLTAQAQAQFRVSDLLSDKVEAKNLGAKSEGAYFPGCDPASSVFDWRKLGAVSKVKDQGRCGDCFIFASTAAFESSWFLQNGERISVSEQQILDCSRSGGCSGGWHGDVFNYLKSSGVGLDKDIPYTGHPSGQCDHPAKKYSAINWDYIDRYGTMATIQKIKSAICVHGPVVSAVYASNNFLHYTGGIFNDFDEGDGSSSVNHDVLIVGWDDIHQAWIIKNSWGANSWGENGFMRIRYRANWIGFGAAWIDAIKITHGQETSELKSLKTEADKLNTEAIKETIDILKRNGDSSKTRGQIDHLDAVLKNIPKK